MANNGIICLKCKKCWELCLKYNLEKCWFSGEYEGKITVLRLNCSKNGLSLLDYSVLKTSINNALEKNLLGSLKANCEICRKQRKGRKDILMEYWPFFRCHHHHFRCNYVSNQRPLIKSIRQNLGKQEGTAKTAREVPTAL